MEASVAAGMPAVEARERLVGFVAEMAAGLSLARQRENALLYVRGLIEQGGRKSLQPTLFRLGGDGARYESMQQFLADSPWDPALLVRACAERVAPELEVRAWIVDDTGVRKDGRHSPGVKRQWSGTLGKIDNCQVTVSLHAAGERGTLPLGWSLYLPEEWCDDLPRRRQAKVPDEVAFRTKPALAADLAEQAAGWQIPTAPILADCAYGDDTAFRTRLAELELEYVVSIQAQTAAWGPETSFAVPERKGSWAGPRLSRGPTVDPSRCARSPSGCPPRPGRWCAAGRRRRARTSAAASPSCASPPRTRSATTAGRRAGNG